MILATDKVIALSVLTFAATFLVFFWAFCRVRKQTISLWVPVPVAAAMLLATIWLVYRGVDVSDSDPLVLAYEVGEVLIVIILMTVLILGARFTFTSRRKWLAARTRARIAAASTTADRRSHHRRPSLAMTLLGWSKGVLMVIGIPAAILCLFQSDILGAWAGPVFVGAFILVALAFLMNHSPGKGRAGRTRVIDRDQVDTFR